MGSKIVGGTGPEAEINRFLAANNGRAVNFGQGLIEDLSQGTLVKIKDDCGVNWLRGRTLMFLGWQRYYERGQGWEWIEEWGWDNGVTTHLKTSHQVWLIEEKVVLMDLGASIVKVITKGSDSQTCGKTIKWVQSISKNSYGYPKNLVPLTEEQIAYEENDGYRIEKLSQREDLATIKDAWLKVAVPTTAGASRMINMSYGQQVEEESFVVRSELFKKHKTRLVSWINWNPKWSPVNAILRNFTSEDQQKEFCEDIRLWLIELEEAGNLKNWEKHHHYDNK